MALQPRTTSITSQPSEPYNSYNFYVIVKHLSFCYQAYADDARNCASEKYRRTENRNKTFIWTKDEFMIKINLTFAQPLTLRHTHFSLRTLTSYSRHIPQDSDFIICKCFLQKYRALSTIFLHLLINFLTASWPDNIQNTEPMKRWLHSRIKLSPKWPTDKKLINNAVKWPITRKLASFVSFCTERTLYLLVRPRILWTPSGSDKLFTDE